MVDTNDLSLSTLLQKEFTEQHLHPGRKVAPSVEPDVVLQGNPSFIDISKAFQQLEGSLQVSIQDFVVFLSVLLRHQIGSQSVLWPVDVEIIKRLRDTEGLAEGDPVHF